MRYMILSALLKLEILLLLLIHGGGKRGSTNKKKGGGIDLWRYPGLQKLFLDLNSVFSACLFSGHNNASLFFQY